MKFKYSFLFLALGSFTCAYAQLATPSYSEAFQAHLKAMTKLSRYQSTPFILSTLQPSGSGLSQTFPDPTLRIEPAGYLTTSEQRSYGGSNLIYQAPLLKMLYDFGGQEGQTLVRNYVIAYFKASSTLSKEGLPGSGNHLYFDPLSNKFPNTVQDVDGDVDMEKAYHEWGSTYQGTEDLLNILHTVSPVLAKNYAEAIWKRHVFSAPGTPIGHWDRHDKPSRIAGGKSWAASYLGTGTNFMRAFLFQYKLATTQAEKDKWKSRFYSLQKFLRSKRNNTTRLYPLLVRRDMGILNPYKLGWRASNWPDQTTLNADLPVYIGPQVCTAKGYLSYDLPLILRDPAFPNVANRMNPKFLDPDSIYENYGSALKANLWKVCTQTAEAPTHLVPLLVEASNVLGDPQLLNDAVSIMSRYHNYSFKNNKLQVSHHLSCDSTQTNVPTSPALAQLLVLYEKYLAAKTTVNQQALLSHYSKRTGKDYSTAGTINKAIAAIADIHTTFKGEQDCTLQSSIDADWSKNDQVAQDSKSLSYPEVTANNVWNADIAGEDSALLPYRGYVAIAKATSCSICRPGIERIAAIVNDSTRLPRMKIYFPAADGKDAYSGYSSDYGTLAWLYAEAIRFNLELARLTANAQYKTHAKMHADRAIENLYVYAPGVFRSHSKLGYESVSGADYLALQLLNLSSVLPIR